MRIYLGKLKGQKPFLQAFMSLISNLPMVGDKGVRTYSAWDGKSEIEYSVTDKFNASAYFYERKSLIPNIL